MFDCVNHLDWMLREFVDFSSKWKYLRVHDKVESVHEAQKTSSP